MFLELKMNFNLEIPQESHEFIFTILKNKSAQANKMKKKQRA